MCIHSWAAFLTSQIPSFTPIENLDLVSELEGGQLPELGEKRENRKGGRKTGEKKRNRSLESDQSEKREAVRFCISSVLPMHGTRRQLSAWSQLGMSGRRGEKTGVQTAHFGLK